MVPLRLATVWLLTAVLVLSVCCNVLLHRSAMTWNPQMLACCMGASGVLRHAWLCAAQLQPVDVDVDDNHTHGTAVLSYSRML